MDASPSGSVWIDLDEPPVVVNVGRGTHGLRQLEDRFRLPELWSLHLYGYHGRLDVDAASFVIAPGMVSLVPPATDIRYRYEGPSTHLYAHLRAGGGADGARRDSRSRSSRLALLMSPGAELPVITDLMESAVASAPVRPARSRADIWSLLLRLAAQPFRPSRSSPSSDHVRSAMSFIESRLPESLSVPQVAAAVGVSANHLARVFTAETQQTVVGYIRRRRIDHARRLLATTTMSITAVAASVGLADLQTFNKACRAVTGQSPRQLREGRSGR